MRPFAVLLVLGLPTAPIVLRRSPKVGDHANYAMKALIDLGGKDDVRFTGSFDETVKKVEDGVVTTDVASRVSVDALGMVRQGGTLSSTREERLDGTLLTPIRVDSTLLFAVPRVDRLRALYLPKEGVEVGASWWHTEGTNEGFKAPPFSSYEKLEGEDKIGERSAWRVSVDAHEVEHENPVHVKGMAWLDKADGSLLRGQWAIDGFVYNATTPAMSARLELAKTGL